MNIIIQTQNTPFRNYSHASIHLIQTSPFNTSHTWTW